MTTPFLVDRTVELNVVSGSDLDQLQARFELAPLTVCLVLVGVVAG